MRLRRGRGWERGRVSVESGERLLLMDKYIELIDKRIWSIVTSRIC